MGSPDTSMITDWANWLQYQRNRMVVLMVMAALAMVIPLVANNYILEVLTNAWFYTILCLGLNIVVGYAGLLDLGY
ncbi:MAG: branched-chain amino acid ABC transporter permease, partial [Deltaproteobacteria bacterium]|nr:branched-chain amino acid ABC transporter permease [Deltaproteobacteria bacterium]